MYACLVISAFVQCNMMKTTNSMCTIRPTCNVFWQIETIPKSLSLSNLCAFVCVCVCFRFYLFAPNNYTSIFFFFFITDFIRIRAARPTTTVQQQQQQQQEPCDRRSTQQLQKKKKKFKLNK